MFHIGNIITITTYMYSCSVQQMKRQYNCSVCEYSTHWIYTL